MHEEFCITLCSVPVLFLEVCVYMYVRICCVCVYVCVCVFLGGGGLSYV